MYRQPRQMVHEPILRDDDPECLDYDLFSLACSQRSLVPTSAALAQLELHGLSTANLGDTNCLNQQLGVSLIEYLGANESFS